MEIDRLGVVRQHRWLSADKQAAELASRCRLVVSLGGGSVRQATREEVEKLARPGCVVELVHAFLLSDPRRKKLRGGLQADFRAALARLERRGAVVVDVDGSVCSQKHRRAFLALVDSDIARSNQGAKSATNGARSKGRPRADFTEEELREAKSVWRNTKDYPTWEDAAKALPSGFTPARAFKLWKGRQ